MDIFKRIWGKTEETARRLKRDETVQKWLDEVAEAEKREDDWRKNAKEAERLYEQQAKASEGNAGASVFNILFANTEILEPAVYNNTPRPVVKRKVDKQNPLAVAAALVLKHTLTYLTDTGDQSEESFDELQKLAVREALVPGRGLCRFSYDHEKEGGLVKREYTCGDPVPWNRVVYGYSKQWSTIPWMGFEHYMTREECVAKFGEKGRLIRLTHQPAVDGDKDNDKNGPEDAEGVKFAHVWEIWDRHEKKIIFVSEGFDKVIDEQDDTLRLSGFFPCPRPIQFIRRISSLVPQTPFNFYQNQAKELEKVTRRINGILDAMKVRGFYDGTLEGLDELMTKPENTLIPAKNVAAMQQGMSLEKAIWFMPLEALITVLQQLYVARQQIISVIHQITGIADIMRGSSAASETLGAQKIKEAWGTMRLKRMQKEVQRFTRDCYRMQAEIAAKHFSIETLIEMTGLRFPRAAEKQQAEMTMQALQRQAGELQAAAQGQLMPPQELRQRAQQLDQQARQAQAILGQPSWEEIKEFLSTDSIRNYVIDIETNSTIDIEATEDKAELAEMMTAMGQLLNGIFPMVEKGVLPFDAAKAFMLNVIQKFRMGDEVEETFRAMQQPQPKEDPAAKKVEAEMKRDEQRFMLEQQEKQEELRQKKEIAALELEVKKQELQFRAQELQLKMQEAQAKHEMAMQSLVMKATMPPAAPKPAPAPSEGDQNASV